MVLSRSGLIYCQDERRSGLLADPGHPLNGVDFVEFRRDLLATPAQRFRLEITFLKPPPPLVAADLSVTGGIRVVDIDVLDVVPGGDPLRLFAFLSAEGDFSTYILRITHLDLDPERCEVRFSFKAGCPSELDCRTRPDCPPPDLSGPDLDYMAKDYQSFRHMILQLIAQRNPGWRERSPADLGIALVEVIAYAGDYLSYYQDAVAAEGYLNLCRSPISAARHALLVDYAMHKGRNAASFVHLEADPATDGVVPTGVQLATRIGRPLRGDAAPPGPVLPVDADFDNDPALADATVFETTARTRVTDLHNELRIHTWGDAECCLARRARQAFLYAVAADGSIRRPTLGPGDYLLLEEVRSPRTALAADADPKRRQVVRLIVAEDAQDPVFTDQLTNGELTPRAGAGDPVMPLQRVHWRVEDALDFPLCLSAVTPQTGPIPNVSLARGNVAPCDHGRTVRREIGPPDPGAIRWPQPVFDLPDAPLTFQAPPEAPLYDVDGRQIHERHDLDAGPGDAGAAAALIVSFETLNDELWTPVRDLLDAGPFDQLFIAEVDAEGRAHLRCGDDIHGRRPLTATGAAAVYRIGNGTVGNLGAQSLVHIVTPPPVWQVDPADPGAPAPPFPAIRRIRQPISARFGTAPETVAEARQFAPEAFRAIIMRAVTEADWIEVASRLEDVEAAHAMIRWTGSWWTVFVALRPLNEQNQRRLSGGGVALTPAFEASAHARLSRYKMAGLDLRVLAAAYVPLEINIEICVAHGHFRGDVLRAVGDRLSTRQFADGARGFFHRLEFSFGQPLHLSALYAAVEAGDGVDSARVTLFKRYWEGDDGGAALTRGVIEAGPGEILRLDNDPSVPEWGVLRLTAAGGP
jgi:hypothetical protein